MTKDASFAEKLHEAAIVPLVAQDDPGRALAIAEALVEGGMRVIEVVLRSENALAGLERIAARLPHSIVGAGTILDTAQCEAALDAGARFIVSPGFTEELAHFCDDRGAIFLPGTMTPGEVQRARTAGLRMVKFFPANLAGGPVMLKALASVFRDMRFMPTGGVGPDNLGEYLALDCVLACGGSWLTPPGCEPERIAALAQEALAIAADTGR